MEIPRSLPRPRPARCAPLAALGLAVAVAALGLAAAPARAEHAPSQGFGAATPGGAGRPVVHVTNLDDSGPGSLRAAVSGGGRTVVFDVAGEIVLSSYVRVRGAFITIDGFTAPPPGITLRGNGLGIVGTDGTHDVIVRGLRVRDAAGDGIGIAYGAYNVLVEHVSIHNSGDGNLDITTGSHDVTVAWSILARPAGSGKNMLVKYEPSRVTLHHNLFVGARQRNPQVRMDDVLVPAVDTTVDLRHNLVWDWGTGYGTWLADGVQANVVGNYYSSPFSDGDDQAKALTIDRAAAHTSGNVSADAAAGDLDAEGSAPEPFPAPSVDGGTACEEAHRVAAAAGLSPRDAIDLGFLAGISLPTCPGGSAPAESLTVTLLPDLALAPLDSPGAVQAGGTITVTTATRNTGDVAAGESTLSFYLSPSAVVSSDARPLASLRVASVAAGEERVTTIALTVPAETTGGDYYVVAEADSGWEVEEADETNNTVGAPLTVTPVPGGPYLEVIDAVLPGEAAPGSAIPLRCTVQNRGGAPAQQARVRFYLSADVTWDADVYLGSRSIPDLAPGEQQVIDATLKIPARTEVGTWYILIVTSDAFTVDDVRAEPIDIR